VSAIAGQAVDTLSGGELHRTAIAAILAQQAEILLLDEPESMLDGMGRHELWDAVQKLKSSGHTLVLFSHNAQWTSVGDRFLWMDFRGRMEILDAETMAGRLDDRWKRFTDAVSSRLNKSTAPQLSLSDWRTRLCR
jgi:energy-coupling factor transporter ATP-binding protein EcfA2